MWTALPSCRETTAAPLSRLPTRQISGLSRLAVSPVVAPAYVPRAGNGVPQSIILPSGSMMANSRMR
jgi:hypothetical protein